MRRRRDGPGRPCPTYPENTWLSGDLRAISRSPPAGRTRGPRAPVERRARSSARSSGRRAGARSAAASTSGTARSRRAARRSRRRSGRRRQRPAGRRVRSATDDRRSRTGRRGYIGRMIRTPRTIPGRRARGRAPTVGGMFRTLDARQLAFDIVVPMVLVLFGVGRALRRPRRLLVVVGMGRAHPAAVSPILALGIAWAVALCAGAASTSRRTSRTWRCSRSCTRPRLRHPRRALDRVRVGVRRRAGGRALGHAARGADAARRSATSSSVFNLRSDSRPRLLVFVSVARRVPAVVDHRAAAAHLVARARQPPRGGGRRAGGRGRAGAHPHRARHARRRRPLARRRGRAGRRRPLHRVEGSEGDRGRAR